jgi:hypothetical protein
MTRRRKQLLSLAALALGLVAFLLIWNREPSYQGRTISEWADIGIEATDTVPRDEPNILVASNAIHQIGASGLPWIRSMIPNRTDLRFKLMVNFPRFSQVGNMVEPGYVRKIDRLSFYLYALGEKSLPLVSEISTNGVLIIPGYFVDSIGPPALPALIQILTNRPPNTQTDLAIELVTEWGSQAVAAGPTLWHQMELNQIPSDESAWLEALAATGYRAEELAQLLLTRLRTNSEPTNVSEREIAALVRTRKWGAEALVSLLDHPSPQIRQCAISWLFGDRGWCAEYEMRRPLLDRTMGPAPVRRLVSPDFGVSAWKALSEAPVSTRLRAVELTVEIDACRGPTNPFKAFDHQDVLSRLSKDPDPQVAHAAANALDGFRLLKGR